MEAIMESFARTGNYTRAVLLREEAELCPKKHAQLQLYEKAGDLYLQSIVDVLVGQELPQSCFHAQLELVKTYYEKAQRIDKVQRLAPLEQQWLENINPQKSISCVEERWQPLLDRFFQDTETQELPTPRLVRRITPLVPRFYLLDEGPPKCL